MGRIKIHISFLFYIFAIYIIISKNIVLYLVYFCCLLLHELTHAVVATSLGYKLNKIMLMPYGVALNGEFEELRANDEVKIAIAGPLFNIGFSIILVAIWWLIPSLYKVTKDILIANLLIALVNLLPIYPLDGGRVVLGLLSGKINRGKAYKRLKIIGYILGSIMIVLFIITIFYRPNISIGMFGIFILSSTFYEEKSVKYQRLYQASYRYKKIEKGLPVNDIIVSYNTTIARLFSLENNDYFTVFQVVDENFNTITYINEMMLEKIPYEYIYNSLKNYLLLHKKL